MTDETTQFTIGAEATCTDGPCGLVTQVVIDPIAKAVTHLIIEPKHRSGLGRLVPLSLVDTTSGDVTLTCTLAEFDSLDHAEQTMFMPGIGGANFGYDANQALAWPFYGLGNSTLPIVTDTLPVGEVAIRRGDHVHASDGDIGEVQGLVIDQKTHHVTHVLLQEGHLWGRKEVAIPISAAVRVDETGIFLNLTKQDVGDLPAAEVEHL